MLFKLSDMKKQIVYIASAGIMFLFFQSFHSGTLKKQEIPDEVGTILKTSCYNCHSTGSNAEKALEKINFDHWDDYKLIKKIELLGNIGKVLEDEKMPPEKFLDRNPDARLSEDQANLLIDWTRQETDKLMQGN
jgi:hypothetical protein